MSETGGREGGRRERRKGTLTSEHEKEIKKKKIIQIFEGRQRIEGERL